MSTRAEHTPRTCVRSTMCGCNVDRVSIECRSSADRVSTECRSSVDPVSIERRSSVDRVSLAKSQRVTAEAVAAHDAKFDALNASLLREGKRLRPCQSDGECPFRAFSHQGPLVRKRNTVKRTLNSLTACFIYPSCASEEEWQVYGVSFASVRRLSIECRSSVDRVPI